MITVRNLAKRFGSVDALQDITLDLPRGSLTVIRGPSGSGKTTLLRLMAGLETPTAGEIHIAGELFSDPTYVRAPYQRGIGLVFQEAALWPHMTVHQNVAFGLLGRPRREVDRRVGEMLASLELGGLARRYPGQLSGGQARRVTLARTLVTRPDRLLLDEPLTHLQPELKARVLALIRQQAQEDGCTVLYVTHNLDEAATLGGNLLTLRDGHLEPVELLAGGATHAA